MAPVRVSLNRFVDRLSHDFRTPLSVIRQYACTMGEGAVGEISDDHRRILAVIDDRADDVSRLFTDMLDFSQIHAGRLRAWRRRCRVEDLIRRHGAALDRKASLVDVDLDFDVSGEIPFVYCDFEQAGRVFVNLTADAIRSCGDDGLVKIVIGAQPDAGDVVIQVQNNHAGGKWRKLNQLWADDAADADWQIMDDGVGESLNVSRYLARLNFGDIVVFYNAHAGGFRFTLPVARPVELMRRYLAWLVKLRSPTHRVSLISAEMETTGHPRGQTAVESMLDLLLHRKDVSIRVGQCRWLIALSARPARLKKFYRRAKRLHARFHLHDQLGLPVVNLDNRGTWDVISQQEAVLDFVREASFSTELNNPA